MSARARILARIRTRQGKPAKIAAEEIEAVRSHLADHPSNPAPRDDEDVIVRFSERAQSLASTIDETANLADAPALIADYLRSRNLPLRAVCWTELAGLDWSGSGVQIEVRPARDGDLIGVTSAFCAIAETGTLMVLSGGDTPPTVSLLPETHIAIVPRERVVRSMEQAWAMCRTACASLPRAVTFISGPSRTADIEQTVTLGAHGPYRVHVVIVGA